MARAKYFTEFERDLIRLGLHMGKGCPEIADAMNRTPQGVRLQVRKMREAGTLGNLPLPFAFADLASTGADRTGGNA